MNEFKPPGPVKNVANQKTVAVQEQVVAVKNQAVQFNLTKQKHAIAVQNQRPESLRFQNGNSFSLEAFKMPKNKHFYINTGTVPTYFILA
jgi:hypothetical protein